MAAVAEAAREAALAQPRATAYAEERLFEPGGVTLEDAILDAWEDLAVSGRAECPVCGGRLRAVGGCGDCCSELS